MSITCGTDEPLPEVWSMEDEEDEVGKVEHVGQVEHLEMPAPPVKQVDNVNTYRLPVPDCEENTSMFHNFIIFLQDSFIRD